MESGEVEWPAFDLANFLKQLLQNETGTPPRLVEIQLTLTNVLFKMGIES